MTSRLKPGLCPAALLFVLAVCFQVVAQSTRPGWGATPYHDPSGTGVTFRVWAPHASSVYVPGQFNSWSTTANPLAKEFTNSVWTGNWSGDIAIASIGQQYKFFINYNGSGNWRHDPRARLCTVSGSGGNDIVYDPAAFNWAGDAAIATPLDDLVIYELHAGTFYTNGSAARLVAATNRLDYLKQLGVSAVELMPIAEFPGSESWGYNPAQMFAVENSVYGGTDALKSFVKACHSRGLAVFLDLVHNHYGPSDLDMWNFDGWSGTNSVGGGGIYFYENDPNLQITPWGNTRPNFSSNQVAAFIQDNASLWLSECHIDGFRWDAPSAMLYANGGAYITAAGDLLNAINASLHTNFTGKISIAEDIYNSFGFDTTWDTSYPYAVTPVLTNVIDANRNLATLTNALAHNVRYGGSAGLKRVAFLESHDVVGDLNKGTRLVTAIDPATPNSYRARKLSLLGAALTFTAPGVPMLFQGQEMLENQQFSSSRPVDWSKTNTYSRIVNCYRDLIRLRRNIDGYSAGLKGDQISFLKVDDPNKLLVSRRWKTGMSASDLVIVANFAGVARTNYSVPFPRTGTWYLHFNTDSTNYSSDFSNIGAPILDVTGSTSPVTIGPYSVQVFSQQPFAPALAVAPTNNAVRISWPADFANWTLETTSNLAAGTTLWNSISSSQVQTNSTSLFFDAAQTGTGFFRLRKP